MQSILLNYQTILAQFQFRPCKGIEEIHIKVSWEINKQCDTEVSRQTGNIILMGNTEHLLFIVIQGGM